MSDSKALTIGTTSVRQVGELYSLNDLHKESGGRPCHRPGYFLENEQTRGLVREIETAGIPAVKTKEGRNGGTYACRELVIAYAAWISAAFHVKVIRVFLAVATPFGVQSADSEQVELARRAAQIATAEVYKTVFDAVMQAEDWRSNRYLLAFDETHEGPKARVKVMDRKAYVLPMSSFHDAIDSCITVDPKVLAGLAATCIDRLNRMAQYATPSAHKMIGVAA